MVNQLPQGWKEVPFNSIFDVCNSGKEKIKIKISVKKFCRL